eukprot:TRINITY_DN931_c0_g3_i5.p1 TRINITY_DN931_c0_g3~~TRINITY_DN931_c0_g3_i5.p1  ORF type:complete len:133 (+),score=26.85 TRINITY_DN931_c0_g3_i5:178-576(+)
MNNLVKTQTPKLKRPKPIRPSSSHTRANPFPSLARINSDLLPNTNEFEGEEALDLVEEWRTVAQRKVSGLELSKLVLLDNSTSEIRKAALIEKELLEGKRARNAVGTRGLDGYLARPENPMVKDACWSEERL